jgi:hypothetical protein
MVGDCQRSATILNSSGCVRKGDLDLIFQAFPDILLSIIEKKDNTRFSRHPEDSLPEHVRMDC